MVEFTYRGYPTVARFLIHHLSHSMSLLIHRLHFLSGRIRLIGWQISHIKVLQLSIKTALSKSSRTWRTMEQKVSHRLWSRIRIAYLIQWGDGVTDDTATINAAISAGAWCVPGSCAASIITPAVVYFPAGTYLFSSSIIDYYYTQLIGKPNTLPTLKGMANF